MTLNDKLALLIEADGLPTPVREWPFAKPRRWRFDFAWPEKMVAAEVMGQTWGKVNNYGKWTGGRHVRGKGYENDAVKQSEAAVLGWRVLIFTSDMVDDGRALALIERALGETNKPT